MNPNENNAIQGNISRGPDMLQNITLFNGKKTVHVGTGKSLLSVIQNHPILPTNSGKNIGDKQLEIRFARLGPVVDSSVTDKMAAVKDELTAFAENYHARNNNQVSETSKTDLLKHLEQKMIDKSPSYSSLVRSGQSSRSGSSSSESSVTITNSNQSSITITNSGQATPIEALSDSETDNSVYVNLKNMEALEQHQKSTEEAIKNNFIVVDDFNDFNDFDDEAVNLSFDSDSHSLSTIYASIEEIEQPNTTEAVEQAEPEKAEKPLPVTTHIPKIPQNPEILDIPNYGKQAADIVKAHDNSPFYNKLDATVTEFNRNHLERGTALTNMMAQKNTMENNLRNHTWAIKNEIEQMRSEVERLMISINSKTEELQQKALFGQMEIHAKTIEIEKTVRDLVQTEVKEAKETEPTFRGKVAKFFGIRK